MAAPVALRSMLFPLYAFNLEVARAPWLTKEPLIAEMRLQWWRDALAEIGAGGPVRRHEVATPLSAALDARGAAALDDLIEARRADIEARPPEGVEALRRYIDRTSGTLLWTAARLAGFEDEPAARDGGLAQGMATYLMAAPDLEARGRSPYPPGEREAQVAALAGAGAAALDRFRSARMLRPVRPVFLVLSDTAAILRAFRKRPGAHPTPSPLASRLRLMRAAFGG